MSDSGRESPPALSAFLRGVERRASLLGELQCGDAAAADAALEAAMRAFAKSAGRWPLAAWPDRFWGLLCAAPALRNPPPSAALPVPLAPLAGLAASDRLALLLRLAVGLEETAAAVALGLDEAAYRAALGRACPRDAEGQPDAAGWRALAEAIQQRLRELPPQRLARLAQRRERALRGEPTPAPVVVAPAAVAAGRTQRRRAWPWVAAALGLLAATAVVVLLAWGPWRTSLLPVASLPAPSPDGLARLQDPQIEQEPLPEAEAPAARYDADFARLTEPDFDLLLDAHGEALAREADLLAWALANGELDDATAPTVAMPEPPMVPEAPEARAAYWQGLDDAERERFERARQAWWQQPLAQREQRRERYAAWRRLDTRQQWQLARTAAQWATLPADQQATLRMRFAALDQLQQRGWRLGLVLGADFPRLHALFGFLPPEERDASLALLAQMDPAQRAAVAVLAQRLPPQAREEFRQRLLAVPPASRGPWLQQQLAR